MTLNELLSWLLVHGLTLVVGAAVLLAAYRIGSSAIHRVVPGVLHAQAAHLPAGTGATIDVEKRVATIEDLLTRLLRVVVLALLGALVLAVFELWPLLVVIVVLVAAIVFREIMLAAATVFFALSGPIRRSAHWPSSMAW